MNRPLQPVGVAVVEQEKYREEHEKLHFAIADAIAKFEQTTAGKVTHVDCRSGRCDLTTTFSLPINPAEAFRREIQRRLDFLDETIDTLEREKTESGDHDRSMVEEARRIQQVAREHFSLSDLEKANYGITWAESCIGVGRRELGGRQKVQAAIEALLRGS